LEQLAEADLLLVQGLPPDSEYRFKHALIQDAAYENLLRSRRQVLHGRVAEILRDNLAGTASAEPALLAHHFTQAGLTVAAIEWWGKAGQRSVERSALIEAAEQFTHALAQIAGLPATPALRREEINLQVAHIHPLIHTKGYAAAETKTAADRARMLIEQATALGEAPEDSLLLFAAFFGLMGASTVAFNGDVLRKLTVEVLALAEKQRAAAPLLIAHRHMGAALVYLGEIAEGRKHLDQVIALYNPAEHRMLTAQFGTDVRAHTLCYRSWASWFLGYPEAALADAKQAVNDAREIAQAATLMNTLAVTSYTYLFCGNYAAASAQIDELATLTDEKGSVYWKAFAMWVQGWLLVLTGKAEEAVHMLTSGITALRSTGATLGLPLQLSTLAKAYADFRQLDEALRCIGEATTAVRTTKETWFEAELNRIAGLVSLESDVQKAQVHFERALSIAREQQAKSWELRAAMSMARLWRDQGKRNEARDLLGPVYGWFTEGFDTLDLKEAKALLDELSPIEVEKTIAQELRGVS
jgi:predicted ATPase